MYPSPCKNQTIITYILPFFKPSDCQIPAPLPIFLQDSKNPWNGVQGLLLVLLVFSKKEDIALLRITYF
ncbi:hypothetical protein DW089_03345 [Acidaminococcus sp. AM05-11]|nr:hypothetical protein DW089_03345 [Acidaminococcus sp. AM05-11]